MTVALAVGLGAVAALLVVMIIVALVRHIHVSGRKNAVDRQRVIDAGASSDPSHSSLSLPSWGFDSIRFKYSVTSEDSADAQSS